MRDQSRSNVGGTENLSAERRSQCGEDGGPIRMILVEPGKKTSEIIPHSLWYHHRIGGDERSQPKHVVPVLVDVSLIHGLSARLAFGQIQPGSRFHREQRGRRCNRQSVDHLDAITQHSVVIIVEKDRRKSRPCVGSTERDDGLPETEQKPVRFPTEEFENRRDVSSYGR